MPFTSQPVTQATPPSSTPQAVWVPVIQASPPGGQPQMRAAPVLQTYSLPT